MNNQIENNIIALIGKFNKADLALSTCQKTLEVIEFHLLQQYAVN